MPAQLSLVLRDDFTGDVESLDLLPWLANEGWEMRIADSDTGPVDEVITMHITGTSDDDLAANVQNLEAALTSVTRRRSGEKYTLWLRVQLDGETNARQALVLSVRRGTAKINGLFASEYILAEYQLGLQRKPFWEEISPTALSLNGIDALGGVVAAVTSPGGDVDARVGLVEFAGVDGGGGPLFEFWAGFRAARHAQTPGDLANFVAVWNLHKGQAVYGAGGDVGTDAENIDSTAADGYKAFVTFSSTYLRPRITINVAEAAASPNDQRGLYLILARAKTTATLVARLRLAHGWPGQSLMAIQPRIRIDSGYWQFYELGTVEIPPASQAINSLVNLNYYTLRIDAELESGSGNLDLDCLVLIPLDGMIHAINGNVVYSSGSTSPMQIVNAADGSVSGVGYVNVIPYFTVEAEVRGGMPNETCLLVIAGQRHAQSVKGDIVTVNLQAWRRWRALRGIA